MRTHAARVFSFFSLVVPHVRSTKKKESFGGFTPTLINENVVTRDYNLAGSQKLCHAQDSFVNNNDDHDDKNNNNIEKEPLRWAVTTSMVPYHTIHHILYLSRAAASRSKKKRHCSFFSSSSPSYYTLHTISQMFLSRRKQGVSDTTTATSTTAGNSVAVGSENSSSKNAKDKPPKGCCVDMMEWIVLFVIFFGIFYWYTFTDKEKSFHKQQMDAQMEVLMKQIEAQTTSLHQQLDSLYAQMVQVETAQQQQQQQPEPTAATNTDAVAADPPPPATASESAAALQVEIDAKQAALNKQQAQVASFCPTCTFHQGGLRTTCGQRKTYILERYGGTEETAILGVIGMDSKCSTLS
eukprot:scaffold34669_cov164-Amphora_coffeaeformis.AAC.1